MANNRQLTPAEIGEIHQLVPAEAWPEKRLRLIWTKCAPQEATFDDFQYFIYRCEVQHLDPLLSEAYLRVQYDEATGTQKPVMIVGIGGALKAAHASGQFDGLKTDFIESNGVVVAATTKIWRKNAKEPFESLVYFDEYAARKRGGEVVYMWKNKPHVMLGKVSQMSCLRIAFAAELGGLYVAEEFDRSEPNYDFRVESTDTTPAVSTVTALAERPVSHTKTPKSEVRQMESNGIQAEFSATKQRLIKDLSIAPSMSKAVFNDYFKTFLDVTSLPRDLALYKSALEMLDLMALTTPDETREQIKYAAGSFGTVAKQFYQEWFIQPSEIYGWTPDTSRLAYRVYRRFGLDSFVEFAEYLQVNTIDIRQPADVEAFLRLALLDRDLASEAATAADADQIGIAFLVDDIERSLDGKLEAFLVPVLREKLEARATRL